MQVRRLSSRTLSDSVSHILPVTLLASEHDLFCSTELGCVHAQGIKQIPEAVKHPDTLSANPQEEMEKVYTLSKAKT